MTKFTPFFHRFRIYSKRCYTINIFWVVKGNQIALYNLPVNVVMKYLRPLTPRVKYSRHTNVLSRYALYQHFETSFCDIDFSYGAIDNIRIWYLFLLWNKEAAALVWVLSR